MGDARRNFDVIVVGVGSMGSAACYHLAGRGVRVLGLERFGVPHGMGSAHGHSRMIRLAYFEHPDYVPLLRRSYALWDELSAELGRPVIHVTGGLMLGPPGAEVLEGSLRSAREHGLPHELLDAAEAMRRFPQFRLPDDPRQPFGRAESPADWLALSGAVSQPVPDPGRDCWRAHCCCQLP